MRRVLIGIGLTAMTATASFGQTGPVRGPNLPFDLAVCAQGFVAAPNTFQKGVTTELSYTCTGPKAVCSGGFSLQPLAVTIPPPGPNKLGPTIDVAGIGLKNGVMVYTCAEPLTRPK